jgi:hypothetical protein
VSTHIAHFHRAPGVLGCQHGGFRESQRLAVWVAEVGLMAMADGLYPCSPG